MLTTFDNSNTIFVWSSVQTCFGLAKWKCCGQSQAFSLCANLHKENQEGGFEKKRENDAGRRGPEVVKGNQIVVTLEFVNPFK